MAAHTPRELTRKEWRLVDHGEPEDSIETGLTSDQGATQLDILWVGHEPLARTIVSPLGEAMNAEPWAFDARLTREEVLAEYLEEMRSAE